MTFLVTGGAGYIGSHLVKKLSEKKHKVIVLDDLSNGFAESLLYGEKFVKGDVRDVDLLERIFEKNKIDVVMHAAGSVLVPESVLYPSQYYSNNVGGILSLLPVCERYGVEKFIFSSSCAVYGNPGGGIASEDSPRRPESPYGASKAMAERILRDHAVNSKMKYAILRYFNVTGADPSARVGQRNRHPNHLIKVCCEAAVGKRRSVDICGEDYKTPDGTCIRDYVHVEDVVSAQLLALEALDLKSELTLNVGYGRGYSVKDIIETCWRVAGDTFKVKLAPRRLGDCEKLVAKVDSLHKLGWRPRFDSLEKMITDSLAYERKLLSIEEQEPAPLEGW